MDNYLKDCLDKLKKKNLNAEVELRILLKKSSLNDREIILSNINFDNINIVNFKKALERRLNNEPISKIFNFKNFWKYNFFVNSNVLDPRPETESIIENVLEYFPQKNTNLKILDMCTGSGCLAISLAKEYPLSNVTATDISFKALVVAEHNAVNLNCKKRIKFIECDLVNVNSTYDIIVCNPPYLSENEYNKTSLEIQLFEPKIAFIANKEGYEAYFRIAKILPKILSKNSLVFMEIGSTQAKKTIKIFKNNNINCLKVAKDIHNLDRVLILNKP